jgi:transcriptional regulator with XRE-family HTH domain
VKTVLSEIIEQKGLQLNFVASQMGMSRSYFFLIISGRRPIPHDFVERAALVLGVPAFLFSSEGKLLKLPQPEMERGSRSPLQA